LRLSNLHPPLALGARAGSPLLECSNALKQCARFVLANGPIAGTEAQGNRDILSADSHRTVQDNAFMTSFPTSLSRHWLLAIDASTEQASLALFDGEATAELSWPAGRNQTTAMLAEIARLAHLAGCDPHANLGCVAIATGPGMFNGLRVGMSVAKGLALASDLDLIGVPTLAIAAHPFAVNARPVVAAAAAGRKRLLWQRFQAADLTPDSPPTNGVFSEFLADLNAGEPGAIVTGELTTVQWTALRDISSVTAAPAPAHLRRAGALAAIGWERWKRGEIDDPVTLEPTYLHAATTPV
jgi:tRNA threonylcarbamoyladenosine biosynthesis protein TsaB